MYFRLEKILNIILSPFIPLFILTPLIHLGTHRLGTTVLTDKGHMTCEPLSLTSLCDPGPPSIFTSHSETAWVLHCGLSVTSSRGWHVLSEKSLDAESKVVR